MQREQASLGATKLTILRESTVSESTWSKLLQSTRVSEKVLAEHLRDLRERGLLARSETGYITTGKGQEVARKRELAEELTKQKPLKRLLVLQQAVHPREVFAFKSLKTILKQKPLTLSHYEGLAVAEALEVTCERELAPVAAVSVYANALGMIGAAIQPGRSSCRLVVSLNLNRGLDVAQRRLERELEDEWDQAKRQKLETILKQIDTQRPRVLRNIHKRLLRVIQLGQPT